MSEELDLGKIHEAAQEGDRYERQIERIRLDGNTTACIEPTVNEIIDHMKASQNGVKHDRLALVAYGEPQSGKTEMMICLTARLLDDGFKTIIHIMNDSVDLQSQNLDRFRHSGLMPMAVRSTEFIKSPVDNDVSVVIFCKKNGKNMESLMPHVADRENRVIIDDEADYATPNSKVNKESPTPINSLVISLVGEGYYIGVTATPARLDLNNTLDNNTEKWVQFKPHPAYTGHNVFFPLDKNTVGYRLKLLKDKGSEKSIQDAVLRFLVTSAYLNGPGALPNNYSMLVHTSGKRKQHQSDFETIEEVTKVIKNLNNKNFDHIAIRLYEVASTLYPDANGQELVEFIIKHASHVKLVILNSKSDKAELGKEPANPDTVFTIIIGGNIVSRGVTFPNLLSMLFTRDVKTKLQQDTYIQRARMFGARGKFLKHFELTIPSGLYFDWHKCFVFHELALATVGQGSAPVWIGDSRINVTSSASVDRSTVSMTSGEMSFNIFDFNETEISRIISDNGSTPETLEKMREVIGEKSLPQFLIDYITKFGVAQSGRLAIHSPRKLYGYKDINRQEISRGKSFFGSKQLLHREVPDAMHHIIVMYNEDNKARVFYKYVGRMQFIENLKSKYEETD